jgi:uncharacterized membrane protein HdeD (DUF308 family)
VLNDHCKEASIERQPRADSADVLAGIGRHWESFIVFTALPHRAMRDRGWTIFMGALSVVAGVVVLGVWLLVCGVTEIMLAFWLRSVGQAATPIAAAI